MALSFRAGGSERAPQEISAEKPPLLSQVVFEAHPQGPTSDLLTTLDSTRPLEPVEPEPYSSNELEWKRYLKARDAARTAIEKDALLAGVPFS